MRVIAGPFFGRSPSPLALRRDLAEALAKAGNLLSLKKTASSHKSFLAVTQMLTKAYVELRLNRNNP